MTSMTSLPSDITGQVVTPGDPGYEDARRVYNAMIDGRPAAVVRCATVGDVSGDRRLRPRERPGSGRPRRFAQRPRASGPATAASWPTCPAMRAVLGQPVRAYRPGAGRRDLGGDFNDATHTVGLATTGGYHLHDRGRRADAGRRHRLPGAGAGAVLRQPGVGRGGQRRTARLVRSQRARPSGPVLGAARGRRELRRGHRAGVLAFSRSARSTAARLLVRQSAATADLLRFYRDFIADAPEGVRRVPGFQIAPPLPLHPGGAARDHAMMVVRSPAGPGRPQRGRTGLIQKIREDAAPVAAEMVGPMPYPALNSALRRPRAPAVFQHYWKANFVRELTDEAIAAHVEHGPKSAGGQLHRAHLPDQRRVPPRRAGRDRVRVPRREPIATVIAGMWPDPADNEKNVGWVRDYYAATAPALRGGRVRELHGHGRRPGPGSRPTTAATTGGWSRSSGSTTRATSST